MLHILEQLKNGVLLFDGAMGTMLQAAGLPTGGLPELYNITHPEVVSGIHKSYVEQGAQVITTNTFQCNSLKIPKEYSVSQLITAAVSLAKKSGATYAALDIGPLGQLMAPMGTLTFSEAYEYFKEQVVAGELAGADVILFETFGDQLELKAGILAAKEHTSLPIFATLTFQEDGRTFVGNDPTTAVLTLQDLGVDAIGLNCSLGPKELLPLVEEVLEHALIPVMVQANAGLPSLIDGETVYTISPEEFGEDIGVMISKGVSVVGGCCGTTPEFIKELTRVIGGTPKGIVSNKRKTVCTSGTKTVVLDDRITVIGERINPTGKKLLKEALVAERWDYVLQLAILQANAGSDVLDVNVGLPNIQEGEVLAKVIAGIQGVVNTPLQIDSDNPSAIEQGVRGYNGKPIINSVNGTQSSMDGVLPLVKKYGALVIGLTLDEKGIPETPEGRFAIAEKIVTEAESYGIPREHILIDCLTLTASAQQDQVLVALQTIQLVKARLGVKTALGVSNVSFGFPQRELLNASFLASAFGAGLDAPIIDPLSAKYMEIVDTYRVFNGEDKSGFAYIEKYQQTEIKTEKASSASQDDLQTIILQGRKGESAEKVKELMGAGMSAIDIVNQHLIPALNIVGEGFEKGKIFLPQLIQSAETVKNGFVMMKQLEKPEEEKVSSARKILMATVQGDIHDIGKNIVCMVLENYGYQVFDLGKDVSPEEILKVVKRENISLIGLSALMTTTVKNMKTTIAYLRENGVVGKFMVGGAVLNEEYVSFVGADYYAETAMDNVRIAEEFFKKAE